MFWYEDEVKVLEVKKPNTKKENTKKVVFYGSSSLRLWETLKEDFSNYTIENQSFGGSTLAACCWFFKRLIPQHKPDVLVIYAGDNDLGDGRHPEEVFFMFKCMMDLIKDINNQIPVAFISVKPSPTREHLKKSIEFTNKIIKEEIDKNYPFCTYVNVYDPMIKNDVAEWEYFEPDGLHLSKKGYEVWKKVLEKEFFEKL